MLQKISLVRSGTLSREIWQQGNEVFPDGLIIIIVFLLLNLNHQPVCLRPLPPPPLPSSQISCPLFIGTSIIKTYFNKIVYITPNSPKSQSHWWFFIYYPYTRGGMYLHLKSHHLINKEKQIKLEKNFNLCTQTKGYNSKTWSPITSTVEKEIYSIFFSPSFVIPLLYSS